MAEGVGFEPTRPFWGLTVFKTAAFNRSATPPKLLDFSTDCEIEAVTPSLANLTGRGVGVMQFHRAHIRRPLGTMESEATILSGTGSQTDTSGRWGDYTSLAIDAADGCTFWYTNQYYIDTGSFSWSTQLASIRFPTCQ
jgi:hypothetical protein